MTYIILGIYWKVPMTGKDFQREIIDSENLNRMV